jgi:hypothetical protein
MDLKKHTICYSGKAEGNKEFGVAFVIEREFKSTIIDFKQISERICNLRIRTTFFNRTLMNVHAPTEDKGDEVKDYFYQQMEETYKEIETTAKTIGLEVNVNKTKMLIRTRRNPRQTGEINMEGGGEK